MLFFDSTYQDFVKRIADRKVIIFGASSLWSYYLRVFPGFEGDVASRTLCVVDNDHSKHGASSRIGKKDIQIRGTEELARQGGYVILLAASMVYQAEICEQLLHMGLAQDLECFSLPLMIYNKDKADNSCVEPYFAVHTEKRIPARIHCFWFSGEEKPEIYKRCIESWHKYCPDYEITEWNSENYDITKNSYMEQAYGQGKWAFVSDYARLDVVYRYGGIYLDMDVELTAPIDQLRNATAFFCRQEDGFIELGSGFGAPRGNGLLKEMLDAYEGKGFLDSTGARDMTPQPERLIEVFQKHNIRTAHDSQVIDDMIFLSNEYIVSDLHPDLMDSLENKIGIHWHNAGWHSEKDRYVYKKSIETRPVLLHRYFKA